jgi:sulfite dehydrogenase (cytochrome) subunit B
MRADFKRAVAVVLLVFSAVAIAEEPKVELKGGPESERARGHCSACHSVDYIQMNSPFMKRATWEAEVRKMIKVMGAPIPESEVAALVDYLTRYYGVE